MRAVIYSRHGCHLCDQARQVLIDHGLVPEVIDIEADSALKDRFDVWIPVVEIDGKIRFRGRIDPVLLRRMLRWH
jgi:predicted thioredoxin/glutaredoxin